MMESHLLFEKKLLRGTFRVYSATPLFPVKTVKQIHSNIVLKEEEDGQEGDAIVGTSLEPLAIRTADCIPLVLLGNKSHAVIHAGWKGLQNKILADSKLRQIDPIYAYIGPHIRVSNYEVQADFKKNFSQSNSFLEMNDKVFFDLTKEVITQLKDLYPKIEILDCKICTFSDERFSSFRRNKTTNRNWNIYIPEGYTR